MSQFRILRPFLYSTDGIRAEQLEAGTVAEITEGAEGLQAEGYIAPPDTPAPAVEIPADWRDLAWPQLRSLAAALGGPFNSRAECIATVEGALAERAPAADEAKDG